MFFKPSVVLAAAVALFTTSAGAVDALAFASTVECRGASFQCTNLAVGACCGPFPTGFGLSVQFNRMDSGTDGDCFNNSLGGCGASALIGNVFGPGNKCINFGGRATTTFVQVVNSQFAKRDNNTACIAPSQFSFVDAGGKSQKIKVPEGQAANIATLFEKNSWAELAKFEKA
ncbi:hypothetical protein ONZ45_g18888 [Pleurotus djamor]|nr:hypothetical protein ONZ45_g18888 [Pleurotus djamor]